MRKLLAYFTSLLLLVFVAQSVLVVCAACWESSIELSLEVEAEAEADEEVIAHSLTAYFSSSLPAQVLPTKQAAVAAGYARRLERPPEQV